MSHRDDEVEVEDFSDYLAVHGQFGTGWLAMKDEERRRLRAETPIEEEAQ